MKKLILVFMLSLLTVGCANNYTEPFVVNTTTDEILFNFDNVIGIFSDGDSCNIEYDDYDVFDYEYLQEITGDSSYSQGYVIIGVDFDTYNKLEADYQAFLSTDNYSIKDFLNNKYMITKENYTYSDGSIKVSFTLDTVNVE